MASRLSLLLGNVLRSSSSFGASIGRPRPLRTLCTTTTTDVSSPTSEPTVEEDENKSDPPPHAFDPFLQGSTSGLVFAKLSFTGRNALKSDVVHFFEGCNLSTQDVKVEYNQAYIPAAMLLQFPSRSSFDSAIRIVIRKGLYRLEKVDLSHWNLLESYNGKFGLLQGIPRNAVADDVERFLCGCNFNSSNMKILMRPGFPEPTKMALVNFLSQNEAMHAFRVKNRSFMLNNRIVMRVLQ